MNDVVTIEVPNKNITVPVDKKTLGDFISGLLGQPQTLQRVTETAFCVDHQQLINLCKLIHTRINQQNAPEILTFNAVVIYRDGITREVTSFPAFEHFAETQNLVSTEVAITMAFLIQFPGKGVPERQELLIYFDTREPRRRAAGIVMGRPAEIGHIVVEIRHTERTWADDMARLIDDEIKNTQAAEGRLKRWMRNAIFPVFAFVFPAVMFGGILIESWLNRSLQLTLKDKANSILSSEVADLESLHTKVDVVVNSLVLNQRAWKDMLFASSVLLGVVFLAVSIYLAKPNPSFVLMSKAAYENKKKVLEKMKKKNIFLILSMLLSVILGVVGNFIYDGIK